MKFIEWTKEQESNNENLANPKTIKTRQERDRLTRMEAMLHELVLLKKILTEAKNVSEHRRKNHAKQERFESFSPTSAHETHRGRN